MFLANRAKVNKKRPSLAYSVTLGVRVPDYEIEKTLWFNEHYEGRYLFRNSIILELVPPVNVDERWKVRYWWQGNENNSEEQEIDPKVFRGGKVEISIPFDSVSAPGIQGKLRFVVSAWNQDAVMEE